MHIVCLGPLTLMAVNHICTYHELPHVVKFQKLRPAGHVGYQCWSEGKTNPNGRKAMQGKVDFPEKKKVQ